MGINVAKNVTEEAVNLSDAALTMAIAIVFERIQRLPAEDKEDLFKLSKIIFQADNPEEIEAAKRAMHEILDQPKAKVVVFEAEDEPTQLARWLSSVSARIKQAREESGMTQAQLEQVTGLPQSHISRLENCVHSPSSSTLEKIAKATGKPISFFDPNHDDSHQ